MDVLASAFLDLLTATHLFYLCLGTLIGLTVAILPGLGGTAGLSLVLPFVYGMEPTSALALMIGLLAPTATGDTFPSVLMGIPGSSASQATVVDGFPLAKKGEGARALSAAFSASLIGGLLGATILSVSISVARPLILSIGLGEQFLLVILALTMVGVLTGASPVRGIACCGIGLLVGTIGAAPATGELRYTFNTVYLSDGIPLTVMALGIFAMPEIIDLLRARRSISERPMLGQGWLRGMRDTLQHPWLVARCSGIGALIGALPGLGGSVVDWVAYGHVVQSSKDREKFGTGDIRGVIAPESANNAVRGGELVPTLFFGIPGSGSMAILLGGFVLIGVEPGLRMVGSDLNLTYTIIWSLALSNVLAAIVCIGLAPQVAKLTTIRYDYIGPFMIALIAFTAFQATRDWGDIYALVVCSALGVAMKRFNWSRPALIIGFVLARRFEASSYQTAQVYGLDFLQRPQSVFIVLLVALSLVAALRIVTKTRKAARGEADAAARPITRKMPQIVFTMILSACSAWVLVAVWDARYLTKLFPMSVAAVTLLLLGIVLVQQLSRDAADDLLFDSEQLRADVLPSPRSGILYYFGWIAAFLAVVTLLGYSIGAALLVFAYITVELGGPLWRNALFGLATIALLALLSYFFFLAYPPGALSDYLNLPWWLK